MAGHHLSIPSSLRTFTKKQIKQVLRHLTAVQEFLELKKPYYASLIRKVPEWSRVIIVIPPNLWGFLPFSKGATSWDTWRCQAPNLQDLGQCLHPFPCWSLCWCNSVFSHLSVTWDLWREYGDDDMTWYDMPVLIRTQLHVTVYVIYIYILYNLLYMIYVYVYLASFWGKKSWQLTVQWRPRAIRCASQTWPRRKRKGRSSTILFVPEYRIPW